MHRNIPLQFALVIRVPEIRSRLLIGRFGKFGILVSIPHAGRDEIAVFDGSGVVGILDVVVVARVPVLVDAPLVAHAFPRQQQRAGNVGFVEILIALDHFDVHPTARHSAPWQGHVFANVRSELGKLLGHPCVPPEEAVVTQAEIILEKTPESRRFVCGDGRDHSSCLCRAHPRVGVKLGGRQRSILGDRSFRLDFENRQRGLALDFHTRIRGK